MIDPPLDELLAHVDSRYTLVTSTAKRARKILEEEQLKEEKSNKAVTTALREIHSGTIKIEKLNVGIK
ncbi:MAG TPA: DNA-directed RNA polymerase subunit omega [Firmicutes bacterium]|jgi:DNA-directed RNA polymerase subunit omega|nr:DNA-directed RNA polymerase subunit omega [Bacillota bacterium]